MRLIDFSEFIKEAYHSYDPQGRVNYIEDISARVSTNHVFRLHLDGDDKIIAKLSYFGTYENFLEDHSIINSLANNLLYPFDNVLAKSLTKNNELFTYRRKNELLDIWCVFYNPIRVGNKLPSRLDESHIRKLGQQMAKFHKACYKVSKTLTPSSKTLHSDIEHLRFILQTDRGKFEHRMHIEEIEKQCAHFMEESEKLGYESCLKIPVFVDWNIGNFSLDDNGNLFSRWDYDWFRTTSRVLDFYFFSRVVSDIGDRTTFSYYIGPLMEERFMIFLEEYHRIFPLTASEIYFIKEAYRFFILNYVIKDGRYFFHEIYATKLQREAYEIYFPSIEEFDAEKIIDRILV